MFHRLWQSGMIRMAHSKALTRFMQGNRATSFLSGKYVAGENPAEALNSAQRLIEESGIRGSFFYLGEYVNSIELVETNVANKIAIAKKLDNSGLDIHISVDPTQIGHSINEELGKENALLIAKHISKHSKNNQGTHCLMLDMEDRSMVDPTISLHNSLKKNKLPVALTLQAYLRRTENDMKKQIEMGSMIRLVKGAFTAGTDASYTSQREIKNNYYRLVELMLSREAKNNGFYPVIATHDDKVQDFSLSLARKNAWEKGEYEFEMLLGVRSKLANKLAENGEKVRLYLPFGSDWWPYAVRRIGENPRNAVLLARSLIT